MAKKVQTPDRDQKDIEAQDKAQQSNNVINAQDEVDKVDDFTTDEGEEEVVLDEEDVEETDLDEEEIEDLELEEDEEADDDEDA